MKLRDMIPLSIGVVGWVVALITFQFTLFNKPDFDVLAIVSGNLFLPIVIGSIFYILALFITYMVVDPKKWHEG